MYTIDYRRGVIRLEIHKVFEEKTPEAAAQRLIILSKSHLLQLCRFGEGDFMNMKIRYFDGTPTWRGYYLDYKEEELALIIKSKLPEGGMIRAQYSIYCGRHRVPEPRR
jgi:hypothetical protein